MTPKQFIKHIRKLEKRKLAICDGATDAMSGFEILHLAFLIGGTWAGFSVIKWYVWDRRKK